MSGAQDINIISLSYLLIFLIPVLILNKKLNLSINKSVLYSISRMIIQLSFVGIYLKYIFDFNHPVVNTIYLFIMISVACFSVLRSTRLQIKKLFFPVLMSILLPHCFMLIFFNSMVVRIDNILEAKYLVPIGGMLLGNCLRGNIIGLNHFYSDLRKNEKIYLFSLVLGGNRFQALKPVFRESIMASINPTIASMATIGLIALPGMMTGQILGGSVPLVAIKYQIAIMLAIFFTQYFSVIFSVLFSIKQGFDGFDMINMDIFY